MSTRHVRPDDLRAWVLGEADGRPSMSVEQHVVRARSARRASRPSCHRWRMPSAPSPTSRRVPSSPGGPSLPTHLPCLIFLTCRTSTRSGTAVRDEIEVPRASALERLLVRLGLPPGDAMLVAAAPALRGSWICAVALAVAFAVGGAVAARNGSVTMFLIVAPIVPVLAVATAFGPEAGPALEQESSAPYPLARLVLLRTAAVLLAALPVVLVGQLVFPEAAAWVWLLPALGFTAVVLAVSTWFGPWRPASAITARLGRRHRRGLPARHDLGGLRAALPRALRPHARHRAARPRPAGTATRHDRKDRVMTATSSTPVSLRGVTKRYRSLAALDDVDLDLGPGITGLLGPNGAGKTTMLRVMATVLRPDAGEVRLLGRDPASRTLAPRSGGGSATSRRSSASRAGSRPSPSSTTWPSSRSGPTAAPAPPRCDECSTSSASATSRRSGSVVSPAASAAGSPWPRRCSAHRSCSSSTSRRPGSTPSSGRRCAACSPTSQRRRRWSSRRTRPRTSQRCAAGSSCSTPGASTSTARCPSSCRSRPDGLDGRRPRTPRRRRRGAPHPAATATSGSTCRAGAELVEPSLEDAYLLLRGATSPRR